MQMNANRLIFLIALLATPSISLAQRSATDQQPVTSNNISKLRTLQKPVMAADGAWIAAASSGSIVRVWSTKSDMSYTIERATTPRFSRDSRWIGVFQTPLPEGSTSKPNSRQGTTLVLVNLKDGSRRTFDYVLSYDFTYSSTYLIYLQAPETKADNNPRAKDTRTKSALNGRKVGTLHQIPLNEPRLAKLLRPYKPGASTKKENVVEFATHPTSDHFAYVFHDKQRGADTLHICKWGVRAWYHGEIIEGLCWGRDASKEAPDDFPSDHITLGFLVNQDKSGKRSLKNSALYTWRPDSESSPPRSTEKFTRIHPPK